jgi:hypothetical protein
MKAGVRACDVKARELPKRTESIGVQVWSVNDRDATKSRLWAFAAVWVRAIEQVIG